jgi:hypothetical protein
MVLVPAKPREPAQLQTRPTPHGWLPQVVDLGDHAQGREGEARMSAASGAVQPAVDWNGNETRASAIFCDQGGHPLPTKEVVPQV